MSDHSKIEWTDATWNPVTGCTKISPGCKHCYAETFAERFRGVKDHPYEQGFDLKLWPERLEIPLAWKRPRMIFVNSMSDLFHKDVPIAYIKKVFKTMSLAHHHVFQVLTKRAERLEEVAGQLDWPLNVWMGVSVENQDYIGRVDHLRKVGAAIRFISVEPLLGPVNLDLKDIHWVIVGGESGPGARPMKAEWATSIRDQCLDANVPFFFKQWGGTRKKLTGRKLEGRTWDGIPAIKESECQKNTKMNLVST
ncbi:MAG: phage Gp37/Gp68 family protein [Planctomycetes bacterium]|nr:phage Gp37/Gp68 family protein [Planctomycetota bacterium]